ncbi:MAG: tRNA (cytidine(34)-2'-O)-methyltransferase [Kiloniellales bacterium]|nr:tRNA (cytidine(34)-2'-O)-methyltransferase [Kiloniellales bacterium]
MRLALFEPDIPQNAGALLRLGACLGVPVDVIEPCGFQFDDRKLRRAGMDYLKESSWRRHVSWTAFRPTLEGRLVLLTTAGDRVYSDFRFLPADTLMVGRESAGVPPAVHASADARLRIPMRENMRSINVALAAAMALGEALRQTGLQPATCTGKKSDAVA